MASKGRAVSVRVTSSQASFRCSWGGVRQEVFHEAGDAFQAQGTGKAVG